MSASEKDAGAALASGAEEPAPASARWMHAAALAVTLGGLALAIHWGVQSRGAFYHDDDINHYSFAEKAWHSPGHRWHLWGRPGYTIPTMFVAHFFGLEGCRVFSAVQTAGVALLAYLIARRMRAGWLAVAAPALVWVQPLTMTLAMTTLTETPAALYMTLAVWLFMRGNRVWACAVFSLLTVTRYETAALAPILLVPIVYDALRRRVGRASPAGVRNPALTGRNPRQGHQGLHTLLLPAAALAWAPAVYVLAGIIHNLPPEATLLHIVGGQYTDQYGRGEWRHYLERWPVAAGAGVLALGAAGVLGAGRRGWLPATMGLALFGLHTVLYRYGLFASGGYGRFMVAEAGLVGALASTGLATLLAGRRPLSAVAVFAALAEFLHLLKEKLWLLESTLPNPGPIDQALNAALWLLAASALTLLVLLVRDNRRLRWLLGLSAACVAMMATTWQARVQIRSLNPDTDPHRIAATEAVEKIGQGPHRDNPGLASHVLIGFIRPNTLVGGSPEDNLKHWTASPPGTLFFWDNKPNDAGQCTPEHPFGRLFDGLSGCGDILDEFHCDWAEVIVFIRLPDDRGPPPPTHPTLPIPKW